MPKTIEITPFQPKPVKFKNHLKKSQKIKFFSGIVLLLFISLLFSQPWNIHNLTSHARPVKSYEEALVRIEKLKTEESPAVNPVGRLIFMTHGKKVERVIVFVHGYTNCPQQFRALGEQFYNMGYNVLVARLPHHGLKDRMTEEHGKLTAEELIQYGDEVVDIAQGLGERVTMAGLSAGANIVAWEAQNRRDLDLAVIIAPVFGYKQIPLAITPVLTNLCRSIIPNTFRWWEPKLKEKGGTAYSYPRFSTRATAQILRLGYAIQAKAKWAKPLARNILFIMNANDASVHPVPIENLFKQWQHQGVNLKVYRIGARLQLEHDLVDPAQPYAKTDVSYPLLIEAITQFEKIK